MMTLDEAWNWYLATRSQLDLFGRFGEEHWEDLPWDGHLGLDEKFKTLQADTIVGNSAVCLGPLDDFAVLILFSVFESAVRGFVLLKFEELRESIGEHFLRKIVDDSLQDLENGSFFRVLSVFKRQDADLVEQVNQVRRYRNWVAHGRRSARPGTMDPARAHARLKRFLDEMTGE